MNPGCPCLTLFITQLAAGYPLNHVFYLWFALLDTSDIGPILLLLLLYVIMACTALVKFGTAQLSLLGNLKAESKEQTIWKKDFFSDLSRTNLSSVLLFFPLHALAVLRQSENKVAFTKGTNINSEAQLLCQTCCGLALLFGNLLSSTGLPGSEWQVCCWPSWQSHQEGEEARGKKRKERMEGVGDAPTEFWMTVSFFMWGFATNKARDQTNAASSLIQQWGSSCDSLWQRAALLDLECMKGSVLTRL